MAPIICLSKAANPGPHQVMVGTKQLNIITATISTKGKGANVIKLQKASTPTPLPIFGHIFTLMLGPGTSRAPNLH